MWDSLELGETPRSTNCRLEQLRLRDFWILGVDGWPDLQAAVRHIVVDAHGKVLLGHLSDSD